MEDAGASKDDDIDSQDSNTPIEHGHLARNCSIKIIMKITGFWILLYSYALKKVRLVASSKYL